MPVSRAFLCCRKVTSMMKQSSALHGGDVAGAHPGTAPAGFARRLAQDGHHVDDETAELLRARTAGHPAWAAAVLRVTGTHGVRDLMNSRAVALALAEELRSLWDQDDGDVLRAAALCASLLDTVTPASLQAAITACAPRLGVGFLQDAALEPAQLVVDMVAAGVLVPAGVCISPQDDSRPGWSVPWAVGRALMQAMPLDLDRRALSAGLLDALTAARASDLLGEQLIQARRAGRWDVLVHLCAHRCSDALTHYHRQTRLALDNLPRAVAQHAPVLRLMGVHAAFVTPKPGGTATCEMVRGLSRARPHLVAATRSLRPDFLSVLKGADEVAVTAGYATFALHAQGRNGDAVRLGLLAQRRLEQLARAGKLPARQALEMFHYHRGVAAGLTGELDAAAEQFSFAATPGVRQACETPVSRKSGDYVALIHAFLSGRKALPDAWEPSGLSLPGEYTRALTLLDALAVPEAGKIIADREGQLTEMALWPLLAAVEHLHTLLSGETGRWSLRIDDMAHRHPAQLRAKGLATAVYTRMRVEALLAAGRLQQAKALLDEHLADVSSLRVPAARLWLIGGQYERAGHLAGQYTDSMDLLMRERAELRAIAAMAWFAEGQPARGERELRRAAEMCASLGTLTPLVLLPGRFKQVALRLLEDHPVWDDVAARHGETGVTAQTLRTRAARTRDVFPDEALVVELTRRELHILREIDSGATLQEIAERECRALSTVKKQAQAVYRKLQVNSREQAITRAHELGLFAQR